MSGYTFDDADPGIIPGLADWRPQEAKVYVDPNVQKALDRLLNACITMYGAMVELDFSEAEEDDRVLFEKLLKRAEHDLGPYLGQVRDGLALRMGES